VVEFYRETEFKEETGIGRIPKDWRIVRFKNILKEVDLRGKDIGDAEKLPVLSLTKDFGLIPQEQRFHKRVAADDTSNYKVVKRGWLVYNPYVIWEGAICVLRDIEMGLVSPVYPVWEPTADVDYHFLHYLIRTKRMLSTFFRLATGVVQRRRSLKKKDFLEILIPLPPLEEQKLIARILYSMDGAIQAVDASIAKWERLKKGLMQELLTKGIGHKEFKETEIGRIPASWDVVELKEIAEELYYGLTAKAVEKDTGLRMLRTTDIKDYSVNWSTLPFCEITDKRHYDISRYLLRKGDIIVARAGTVGVSVLVEEDFNDVIFGSYLIKVKLKPEANPKFIHYFFQSRPYWQHIQRAQGSTLKNINLPLLKSLKIPLPPLEEQKRITEILSSVDAVLGEKKRKKARLERVKKALMDLLLTGKVRVRA